jgi:hypothetical protein
MALLASLAFCMGLNFLGRNTERVKGANWAKVLCREVLALLAEVLEIWRKLAVPRAAGTVLLGHYSKSLFCTLESAIGNSGVSRTDSQLLRRNTAIRKFHTQKVLGLAQRGALRAFSRGFRIG